MEDELLKIFDSFITLCKLTKPNKKIKYETKNVAVPVSGFKVDYCYYKFYIMEGSFFLEITPFSKIIKARLFEWNIKLHPKGIEDFINLEKYNYCISHSFSLEKEVSGLRCYMFIFDNIEKLKTFFNELDKAL